jgi:hypothetical protein
VTTYEIPSFTGQKVKVYWKDNLIPISMATIGDEDPPYNRIWYQVGENEFVHSGMIQPVRTILNQPVNNILESGVLAEVTVPYTDARQKPDRNELVIYRYYYNTVYWVIELVYDTNGEAWYGIWDDKWQVIYYVLASHLRILTVEEISPLSPEVPLASKRLEVHTAKQFVIAYERDVPVFMARVASGALFSSGDYSTQPGRYITFCKRPCRHMAAGDLASNGYDLPGVPWICYITENGLAFHGTYWHNNFGKSRSHGCINLTPQAAKWVYRWTQPIVPPTEQQVYVDYGTVVDVI